MEIIAFTLMILQRNNYVQTFGGGETPTNHVFAGNIDAMNLAADFTVDFNTGLFEYNRGRMKTWVCYNLLNTRYPFPHCVELTSRYGGCTPTAFRQNGHFDYNYFHCH